MELRHVYMSGYGSLRALDAWPDLMLCGYNVDRTSNVLSFASITPLSLIGRSSQPNNHVVYHCKQQPREECGYTALPSYSALLTSISEYRQECLVLRCLSIYDCNGIKVSTPTPGTLCTSHS